MARTNKRVSARPKATYCCALSQGRDSNSSILNFVTQEASCIPRIDLVAHAPPLQVAAAINFRFPIITDGAHARMKRTIRD